MTADISTLSVRKGDMPCNKSLSAISPDSIFKRPESLGNAGDGFLSFRAHLFNLFYPEGSACQA